MSARDTHQRFESAVERALKGEGLKPKDFSLNSVAKGGRITVTVKLRQGLGSTAISNTLKDLATSKGFELVRV